MNDGVSDPSQAQTIEAEELPKLGGQNENGFGSANRTYGATSQYNVQ